jgi:hypothetical protein
MGSFMDAPCYSGTEKGNKIKIIKIQRESVMKSDHIEDRGKDESKALKWVGERLVMKR